MGKEKFHANVRPVATDVQEEEQSRFTGRTIKSKKHLREGESDSAQVSKIILAEDLDSTSEEVESTISSSSNSGFHRRSRKLATMMSVDENSNLLLAAAQSRRAVQSVTCYPDCSQQSAHYRESNEVWTANTRWVLVQLKVIEGLAFTDVLTLPIFPTSTLLVEKLKLYTPISEKVFLCM
ncbi:unnamed protein product [Sphagnum tenellum]